MRRFSIIIIFPLIILMSLALIWSNYSRRTRLLCFVLADDRNVEAAVAVKRTWGSRCDTLLFFSSSKETIRDLGSIVLPTSSEGYSRLWGKVRAAWNFLHKSNVAAENFDWFLKADDDTFVLVENLRSFLSRMDPNAPVWYGALLKNPKSSFRSSSNGSYNSGGAGYVLSKKALSTFRPELVDKLCSRSQFGYEDLEMGRCLERLGIKAGDTRDAYGRETFLPLSIEELMFPSRNSGSNTDWYWKSLWSTQQPGMRNCCSPDIVSFHHVQPRMMYILDYVIYGLRINRE